MEASEYCGAQSGDHSDRTDDYISLGASVSMLIHFITIKVQQIIITDWMLTGDIIEHHIFFLFLDLRIFLTAKNKCNLNFAVPFMFVTTYCLLHLVSGFRCFYLKGYTCFLLLQLVLDESLNFYNLILYSKSWSRFHTVFRNQDHMATPFCKKFFNLPSATFSALHRFNYKRCSGTTEVIYMFTEKITRFLSPYCFF